jgi:hypothetical protein
MERDLSFGEEAVGLAFNPNQSHEVHKCKQEFAVIIDRMNYLREITHSAEVKRMASIAITEAQTAQMWAVKAITWQMYAVKAITWKD